MLRQKTERIPDVTVAANPASPSNELRIFHLLDYDSSNHDLANMPYVRDRPRTLFLRLSPPKDLLTLPKRHRERCS